GSGVSHWNLLVPQARNQRPADRARGALSKDAGFRRTLSRAVADGIDVGKACLERLGLDRHIAVLGHAASLEHLRGTDGWDAKKKLVAKLPTIVEGHHPALRVHQSHF